MTQFSLIVRCDRDGSEHQIGTVDAHTAEEAIRSLANLMVDAATHMKNNQPINSED